MRELSELDKALIVNGIPQSTLRLFCPGLQGRSATLIDRSQQANHGTISGATWTRLPRGLWVLSLDGINDSVSLTDNLLESDFWLHFWVKTTDNSTAIISSYDASAPYWHVRMAGDTLLRFYGRDDAAPGEAQWSGGIIGDGVWHCVDVVLDQDTDVYLYVDAVESSTLVAGDLTRVAGTLHGSKTLNIGKHPSISSWWEGYIGLLAWDNSVPSSAKITSRYTRQRHLLGV